MMKSFAAFLITAGVTLATVNAEEPHTPVSGSPQSLVGTWKLTAYEDHLADGSIEYPYGGKPVGLLIYDATGHMAIQIMKMPHPKVASGDEEKVAPEEKRALFDSYIAYFGTYVVDWAKKTVTHKVAGDLYDVYVGTSQDRPFQLNGDRLTLTPRWTEDGKNIQGLRIFDRVQ